MRRTIPNAFSWMFMAWIIYVFGCLYQAINVSTEMVFLSAKVTDTEGRVERPFAFGDTVKRGERIIVKFRVPARSVTRSNHVERRLIDAGNAEVVVSKTDRTWKANAPFEVEGHFPIPMNAATGCGGGSILEVLLHDQVEPSHLDRPIGRNIT